MSISNARSNCVFSGDFVDGGIVYLSFTGVRGSIGDNGDVVTDGDLDTDSITQTLIANVENEGIYAAVKPVKVTALKEQGFKVWRARVAGITEASLQPEKVTAEVEIASVS